MPSDVGMRLQTAFRRHSDGIQTAFRRKLNMKKILYFLMFVFSTSVLAGGAEDNLLSIQSGYRALLQKQNNLDGKIIGMQSDLEDARRRLQAAQADIARLEAEIPAAMAQKARQAEEMRQIGVRLDHAWNAVYGAGERKRRGN
ncbi:TPA: hypothetical protein WLP42_000375 [Neisseria gonorrhoeae]|uniref:hypothetical protein n=2 Tax=Neisseria gonorrhoeae TaxID=485 RepID=UPI000F4E6414|nr:hypothetical protein [Neisseria gonorrhoeae]ROU58531.1 hypothetical protein EGO73_05540 [Neisseria gonorrhoeae]